MTPLDWVLLFVVAVPAGMIGGLIVHWWRSR
jgi:hypothetical protein